MLVTLMALVLALLATPVYEVSVTLLPPGQDSFDEILNVYQQESFQGLEPFRIRNFSKEQNFYKDAFESLLANLNSSRLRHQPYPF